MLRSLWILIAVVVLTQHGCRRGILAKRNSELCCPTDIRKTIKWPYGEDAIFCPPCKPDHAYYGHKPTCWRDWPTSGEQWRDVNCCICMSREPDVQADGSVILDRLPPTSESPVDNRLPAVSDTPIKEPLPPTPVAPTEIRSPAASAGPSKNQVPAASENPSDAQLPAASGSPSDSQRPPTFEAPPETTPSPQSQSLDSNASAYSVPKFSDADATRGVWFVPDDLTNLTRSLSRTNQ